MRFNFVRSMSWTAHFTASMILLSCTVWNAHCSTIFSLALLVWTNFVPSCNGYVNWIFPGPEDSGLTFNYDDTVYFTWTSNITDPWMNLWCAPNQSSHQSSTYGKTCITLKTPLCGIESS